MSLKIKMAKGILWSIVERGGQQIISFLLFLLIARLVGPEEYGLAMLCFVYFVFASVLLLGMADSVVILQIKDRFKLSTLFWTIMSFGVLLSALCFSFAGIIAVGFDEPGLELLFKWLSIVPLLLAAQSVPYMIVMQSMNFKVYAVRSLVATIGSGAVGIYMAYSGFGALSLVIQQIVLYSIANIILWFFVDWRPHFSFKRSVAREVITPGLKMMVSNILTFFEQQIPRLFLGHFLGAKNVAYFSFAFRMRFALQDILIEPAFVVLLPALSQIINDKAEQDKILQVIFFLVGFIVFPVVILAALTVPLYVPLLFGEKWVDAMPILQVFLVLGLATPFANLASVIFRVNNKINIYLRGQALVIGSSLIAVYFMSQISLMAAGWAIFGFTVLSVPLYFFFLERWVKVRLWHHFSQLSMSIVSTIVMALLVYFFMEQRSGEVNTWANLFATLTLGGITYLILSFLLQRKKIMMILPLVKALIKKQ